MSNFSICTGCRFLGSLKKFVQNKAKLEGSIVEAYIAKECLTFCSMCLEGIETWFNREDRNYDNFDDGGFVVFSQKVWPFRTAKYVEMQDLELVDAHWYILNNCEELKPYFQ